MVRIVQLVRTPDCGSGSRRFESVYAPNFGEMVEWFITEVLKTSGPKKPRRFESGSLRYENENYI